MQKQVKDPYAVATAAARQIGYKDFSAGSPGREKRNEIADALIATKKMQKQLVALTLACDQLRSEHERVEKGGPGSGRKREDNRSLQPRSPLGRFQRKPVDPEKVQDAVRRLGLEHAHRYATPVSAAQAIDMYRAGKISRSDYEAATRLNKGGPGSGRKPGFVTTAKRTAQAAVVAPAVARYEQERTPTAHAAMVEAFRQREAKKKPSEFERLEHPWDVKKDDNMRKQSETRQLTKQLVSLLLQSWAHEHDGLLRHPVSVK